MLNEAIKLELIEWLTNLDDDETIEYLKIVKDAKVSHDDWWYDLKDKHKEGIERGLKDIDAERFTLHEDVKKKYGL
jgi:hypothetical protein